MSMAVHARRICIIGGGPAGLAAAIALRQEDISVTVLDCATPPVDKACGEGLMPDTMAALAQLGVELPERAGFPLQGITFVHEGGTLTGNFSRNTARGVRRTVLHESLRHRALELGVECIWGARRVRIGSGEVTVDGSRLKATIIVGADGQNSQVRHQAALGAARYQQRRFGFRQHYRIAPWSDSVQLYWGRQCQIYVTPIAQDEVGVALISNDPHLRLRQALVEFPDLKRRLESAQATSRETGAITGSRSFRRICGPGIALIGDASGSVDAITGEGLNLAFRQAIALAQACKTGDLLSYQLAHRELRQRPQAMAALLLLLARHSGLRRRVFTSFSQHPEMFNRMLAIHTGEASFRELLSWRLLPAGACFLRA